MYNNRFYMNQLGLEEAAQANAKLSQSVRW